MARQKMADFCGYRCVTGPLLHLRARGFAPITYSSAILLLLAICASIASRQCNAQDLQPAKTFQDCPECPVMVVIPAGHFLMGSSDADTERDLANVPKRTDGFPLGKVLSFGETEFDWAQKAMAAEHPQHPVEIKKDFALGRSDVTVEEFSAFVMDTGYRTGGCYFHGHSGRDTSGEAWRHPGFRPTRRDPVVCVNWYDAKAYVRWLNQKIENSGSRSDNYPYGLPSEAEWEYAARAGTRTERWWGNDIGKDNARCSGCESVPQPAFINGMLVYPPCCGEANQTAPVESFPANPFGLYDMLGNASQWTEDCWHEDYEGAPSTGAPWEGEGCSRRSLRGGGWSNSPWSIKATIRGGSAPDLTTNSSGFRVMKALP